MTTAPVLDACQNASSNPTVTVPDDDKSQQKSGNSSEDKNNAGLIVTTNGHNGESTSDSDQAEDKSDALKNLEPSSANGTYETVSSTATTNDKKAEETI